MFYENIADIEKFLIVTIINSFNSLYLFDERMSRSHYLVLRG